MRHIKVQGMRFALIFAGLLTACGGGERDLPVLGRVGGFKLTSVTGERASSLSDADLSGRVWIVDFIWTRCKGPCFWMSGNMAKLQRALPETVLLVSVSVDPVRDDVPSLKAYARHFLAKEGRWFFLTGDKASVYTLIEKGFKLSASEDPAAPLSERFVHSTKFVLVDGDGQIRGYYDGEDPGHLKRLRRDAVRLASPGKADA